LKATNKMYVLILSRFNVDIGAAEVKKFCLLLIGSKIKIKSNCIENKGTSNIFGTLWPPM